MDSKKKVKREKRLSEKEKSLKRRRERDRRDRHVQGMFSEAAHEESKQEVAHEESKQEEATDKTDFKGENSSKKTVDNPPAED